MITHIGHLIRLSETIANRPVFSFVSFEHNGLRYRRSRVKDSKKEPRHRFLVY